MKPLILVTGATGKTGTPVIEQLLERGYPIRALVHSFDERSERLQNLGAEVVLGDFEDLKSIRQAVKDVKRVYFVYPPTNDHLVDWTKEAVEREGTQCEFSVRCRVSLAIVYWALDPLRSYNAKSDIPRLFTVFKLSRRLHELQITDCDDAVLRLVGFTIPDKEMDYFRKAETLADAEVSSSLHVRRTKIATERLLRTVVQTKLEDGQLTILLRELERFVDGFEDQAL